MKPDIELMHQTWQHARGVEKTASELSDLKIDEIVSSIFTTGPFYFYIVDFSDLQLSNISSGMSTIHGINLNEINSINDVLSLIHPDDMEFVAKAEERAIDWVYKTLGIEKITKFKFSYNFRFKTPSGYELFNHQSLVLTTDSEGRFCKSLNIHTNISHLTSVNNYKLSIIGLLGEPSYLNIDVFGIQQKPDDLSSQKAFSKREIQIINMLSQGHSTEDIAQTLFISAETVKTHRKNILKKSDCKNTIELIARCKSEGWI